MSSFCLVVETCEFLIEDHNLWEDMMLLQIVLFRDDVVNSIPK